VTKEVVGMLCAFSCTSPEGSWAFKRIFTGHHLVEEIPLIAIDRPGFGYSDFGMLKI
jgi:pimeloyl-ACP methyl ester carboxylesterase